jgi:hypothetical protein
MSTDWIPFDKPTEFVKIKLKYWTNRHGQKEVDRINVGQGWIIAWRPSWNVPKDAFQQPEIICIEYLTSDAYIIMANDKESVEFIR